MMTPAHTHEDDDGYGGGSGNSGGASSQSYVALRRSDSGATVAPPTSLCAYISFFPLHAAQRLIQCFGYSHTVKLQSGRTVIVGAEIAQGGYSYVFHARDANTGEAFALKKILCQTEEHMAMAKREIETHRSFLHANIMPLSDYAVVSVDQHTHEYYLLFPYMENGTLREMIDVALSRRLPIPERLILGMFLKVCRAVGEMHARTPPLVHRDIKPENVLLTQDDEPVLTDFGSVVVGELAVGKRADALLLQEKAAQYSSMPYRAPELYDVGDNTHLTPRTDVWSLGCLLYAMAFGYSPFECTFTDSGEVKIVECSYLAVIGAVKFPKTHTRSQSLVELIRWMLTPDPSSRPSVFELIDRLHATHS